MRASVRRGIKVVPRNDPSLKAIAFQDGLHFFEEKGTKDQWKRI